MWALTGVTEEARGERLRGMEGDKFNVGVGDEVSLVIGEEFEAGRGERDLVANEDRGA